MSNWLTAHVWTQLERENCAEGLLGAIYRPLNGDD